jgi:Ca-activated chloride channel family protein
MGLSGLHSFHFLHPLWLVALAPLWLLAALLARQGRRDGGWGRIIDSELLGALRLGSTGKTRSPWWLLAAIWTLAALALAGMTWQREQSAAFRAPLDWIVVLDLSPSMAAADVSPSRVGRARYVISDLLDAAHDARVALVVFAGDAHTVVPLTTDVATIRSLLPPLAPTIMPESGDQLAPALDEAGRLMQMVATRHTQVVVLTDGVGDPAESMQAAKRLSREGATVNVIGVGTAGGAPETGDRGGFVHDAEGRSVLSRLPVDQLQHIAAAGGGHYVPVSEAGTLIGRLQSQRASASEDEREDQTGQQLTTWRNDSIWLLPPLLLLVPLFARRGWL